MSLNISQCRVSKTVNRDPRPRPTTQAVLFMDGGVMFSYKDMSVIDPNHESHQVSLEQFSAV